MMYMVDTNVCIEYINGRAPALFEKFHQVGENAISTSSITVAELTYGIARNSPGRRRIEATQSFLARFPILPFDAGAADLFGEVKRDLERRGQMIGGYDILIACIALANNLILVTHNTREFSRVEGLRFEDWEL